LDDRSRLPWIGGTGIHIGIDSITIGPGTGVGILSMECTRLHYRFERSSHQLVGTMMQHLDKPVYFECNGGCTP
jgi:hypothetical protein